jgi:TonB family protein
VAAPNLDGRERSARWGYIGAILLSALGHAVVLALVLVVLPDYFRQSNAPPPNYTVKIVDRLPAGDLGTHLPRLGRQHNRHSARRKSHRSHVVERHKLPPPPPPKHHKNVIALNTFGTPTPTPMVTPKPTPEPTLAPTAEPTIAPTPTPTPKPTPRPTPKPTPRPTPKPTPKPRRRRPTPTPTPKRSERKLKRERELARQRELARKREFERERELKLKRERRKIKVAHAKPTPSVEQQLAALKQQLLKEDLEHRKLKTNGAEGGGPVVASKASEGSGYGVGSGKGSVGIQQDRQFLLYYRTVQERIKKAWSFAGGGSSDLTADVTFAIGPGGKLTGVKVTQSSKDPAFDASVIRAIRRAAPFPPPPQKYRSQFAEGVDAVFKLGELKS